MPAMRCECFPHRVVHGDVTVSPLWRLGVQVAAPRTPAAAAARGHPTQAHCPRQGYAPTAHPRTDVGQVYPATTRAICLVASFATQWSVVHIDFGCTC